ncbi:DUF4893 domain-containing protein [Sulfitobacter sp. BSw21498]|uniref:DUF4893 domain-containing protein n=1 Tax=Sulfitobacter sp. BSw21498 TaxID=664426 RepID=UPI001110CC50|nr:DUF4893 domain-containing protein [Sulfitobacter sp. BSw21498]
MLRYALTLTAMLGALPAIAQEALRPQEQLRLDRLEAVAGNALLQALQSASAEDLSALAGALSGTPQVAFDEGLAGDWSCRTIKLGGMPALVVYSPFKCRLTFQGNGYLFEKLSGSQRTMGFITLRDGQAIYAGVGYVAGETPPAYNALPPEFAGDGTVQPDVAVFERVNNQRARLMFPAPVVESDFDILELTR